MGKNWTVTKHTGTWLETKNPENLCNTWLIVGIPHLCDQRRKKNTPNNFQSEKSHPLTEEMLHKIQVGVFFVTVALPIFFDVFFEDRFMYGSNRLKSVTLGRIVRLFSILISSPIIIGASSISLDWAHNSHAFRPFLWGQLCALLGMVPNLWFGPILSPAEVTDTLDVLESDDTVYLCAHCDYL